ncbi:MAG: hypothetical protein PHX08_11810 [Lachnospiraceae bacterium]|nr:hypothetical protein [Lachnospiraceae bacterium]
MPLDYEYYIVSIEKIENGVPSGYIVNTCIKDKILFSDLGDMILKINHALRWIQEEIEKQGTKELPCLHSLKDAPFTKRSKYFFLIQMIYADDISWHGVITGTDGIKTCFKSTLDLLCKIEQSMYDSTKGKNQKKGRTGI